MFVCFSSRLAKGLSEGLLSKAGPLVSLVGLSGGGVASCDIGLNSLESGQFLFSGEGE